MKRVILLAVAVLLMAAGASAQTAKAVEQTVLQLEKEWVEALLKSDAAKLEEMYADALVYTHSNGTVDDKSKYLVSIKSGSTKYIAIERTDIKVNVYDDAAIVTCQALMKIRASGEDRTINARMIHVYVKQKGRWLFVAHQTTRLG